MDADVKSAEDLGFDPDALRDKYRAERDKRLRADGNEQYREIKGEFAHYLDDPYVEPGFTRAPLTDEVEVVVIGGGFGGLLAGARLREAGVDDIRMIEKGGDFGGTWYWNRYPGAACDVETYIYLPLLEEIGYMPVEKYSRAPEILAHSRAIGEHFDLYRQRLLPDRGHRACAGTRRPRAGSSRTNRGDAMRARFVVMANGPLHRPKLPGIPGVETLQGPLVPHQPLGLRLHRRRLRTASLDRPEGQAGRHHRHRRHRRAVRAAPGRRRPSSSTSSSARPRRSTCAPTGPPIRTGPPACSPAGSSSRMDNFNALVSGGFAEEDLVNDGWTDIIGNLLLLLRKGAGRAQLAGGPGRDHAAGRLPEDGADPRPGRQRGQGPGHRRGAQALVQPVLQAAVLPRRIPGRLQPAQRHAGRHRRAAASRRSPRTAWSPTAETFELDCLIYATGFEVGTDYTRRAGYEVYGRDGAHPDREVGRRRLDPARHAQPRLPQLLHHQQLASRASPSTSRTCSTSRPSTSPTSSREALRSARRATVEASAGGRGGLGADDRRPRRSCASSSTRSARRATTTTRASPRRWRPATAPTARARSPSSRCWKTGARPAILPGLELAAQA